LLGKTDAHEGPPSSSLPSAFIAEHNVIRSGISLWSGGVTCPGCVPSQFLVHPNLHADGGGVGGNSENLDTVPALHDNQEIGVLSSLFY